MSFRKIISVDLGIRMSHSQAVYAMNSNTSMGLSKWSNKDLKNAEATGDWSELLAKAEKSTVSFRNRFYK